VSTACAVCANPMTADEGFCGQCGTKGAAPVFAASTGFEPAVQSSTTGDPWREVRGTGSAHDASPFGTPPAAPPIDPWSVRLAHGEVVKKTYLIGRRYRSMGSVEGRLTVTDSRLLYHARAKNVVNASTQRREIQISDVSGLALSTSKGLSPFAVMVLGAIAMIGAASLVLGILFVNEVITLTWLLILIVIGTIIFAISRHTEVALVVFARQIEASPIAFSGSNGGTPVNIFTVLVASLSSPFLSLLERVGIMHAGDASQAAELHEAEAMYAELGALILDLQSRGVLGSAN